MTMPSTAVKAMDEATSSASARMTGAVAAIAELPQIELPQAHQQRDGMGQAKPAPYPITRHENRPHDHGNGADERDTHAADRRGTHAGPQQHDGHLQKILCREGNAGIETRGLAQKQPNQGADQDGQHQRLDPRPAYQAHFQILGEHCEAGDQPGQGDTGQQCARSRKCFFIR